MNHILFILWVLVLVWIKTTNGAFLSPQLRNKKCIDQERYALVDFKAHILRDPDGWLSTWRVEEEEDCCKWNGVRCDNQTGLVIRRDGLEGEISPSLLNLTYLTYLDLYDNSFHGTIPAFIGSLSNLRYLHLSGNYFNGNIPAFIGSLSNLRYLHLSGNYFNGTIPISIGSLTKLRYLDLSYNNFHGTIPTSIGSLTQLSYLDLSSNSFHGTIPTSIGSLTELRSLDLSDNYLTGTIPPELGNLTNLEFLTLVNLTSCTIENLDWLSHLYELMTLNLEGISLAKVNKWVNVILSLQNLYYLSLSDCNLSEVIHPYSSSSVANSSSSSKLDFLYLRNNNLNSSMYEWLLPLTINSLLILDLSGNSLAVSFSDFLNHLTECTSDALLCLDVSRNQLTGTVSEKVWELPNLQYLDLSSNSLRGPISQNIGNSKILTLILSNNSLLEGVPSKSPMANLSYVQEVDLSSCKLGPRFPKWIQSLKNLNHLDISNNGILDPILSEFWNMWPFKLKFLNISSNNIIGKILDLLSNFDHKFSSINMSSNNFYGPIPNVPSTLVMLDLSKNKFSGGISFLCQIVAGFLTYLDLSMNLLSGQIRDCLWHFKQLQFLNLENNNLSGRLPVSVESLVQLEVLYLYNNNFSGELPLSLGNCTMLTVLGLGVNTFSGNVPVWIGEKLSGLYVLSLTSNNFFGTIPLQLCQLENLQVLDLSMNNLNGTIPSCLDNLTTMVQKRVSLNQNVHYYIWGSKEIGKNMYSQYNKYVDHAMIKWQGVVRELTSTLGLVNVDESHLIARSR